MVELHGFGACSWAVWVGRVIRTACPRTVGCWEAEVVPGEAERTVRLDGESLTLADVAAVARHGATVALDSDARGRMERSHAWVVSAAEGSLTEPNGSPMSVYGVNTGYGSLARVRISSDRIRALSWNLIRSHAAGVGPAIDVAAVRAMMLLRANALAKGASGCRPAMVDTLCAMLHAGVTPVVPARGSCGSSGDLAPLAHLGLVVFCGPDGASGQAELNGARMTGAEAMKRARIPRLEPGPKEGLAMTNGAQLTAAITALACFDADRLIRTAEIAAALSWEALLGVTRALHPSVHALRPFPGAIACAANLRALLEGSSLVDSVPHKVQDAYSLRCTPQVLGAVRDAVEYASRQVTVELNAVTDNPVILVDDNDPNKAFSAGLFHGEPVGFAADHLKLAMCEVGSLAERRVYRMTTGLLSSRLPPSMPREGSPALGLMLPQTTAAALVATNRQLAMPSSVDSLPTCEDQEDLVAMSTTAARRAEEVLGNVWRVLAIELLTAARGVRSRVEHGQGHPGVGTAAALDAIGVSDSSPGVAIERLAARLAQGELVAAVEASVPLQGVNHG